MQIKLNMNKAKVKVLKARAKALFISHKLYLIRSYTLIAYKSEMFLLLILRPTGLGGAIAIARQKQNA